MDAITSFDQYRFPKEFCERMPSALPKYKPNRMGHRPRADLRGIVDAMTKAPLGVD
jgi:hypothetical protein